MKISEMIELVVENYNGARHNLYFEGSPGIGKTAGMDQAAEVLRPKAKGQFFYKSFILSMYESVDFRGIPSVSNQNTTVWNPADELIFPEDAEGIIFWDELPNANQDVAKAVQQLIHSNRLGNLVIPKGIVHVAAGNKSTDRAGANKLLTALANRFEHHTIEPDVHDWSLWAMKKKMDKSVIAYVNYCPQNFNAFNSAEKINATPRTWEDVSEVLGSKFETLRVMGCVGESIGGAYLGFKQVWQDLPKVADIIKKPEEVAVPKKPDIQHAIMLKLAFEADLDNYDPFMTYVERFGKEMQVVFIKCSNQINNKLTTHPKFAAWLRKNNDVLVG